MASGEVFPYDEQAFRKLIPPKVHSVQGTVAVAIPEDGDETEPNEDQYLDSQPEVRGSIRVQAQIARIGAEMGMQIWVPKADRAAILREWPEGSDLIIANLPLNYDEATIRTIEQIDVLWLRRRSIVRAFEVEHTTSIYSGILRMADLMALQPNLAIKAHIVAPSERRLRVLQEIQRPVFSLLEKGPLAESCTYLSYESVRELAEQKLLAHLNDGVLDEYAEDAEE